MPQDDRGAGPGAAMALDDFNRVATGLKTQFEQDEALYRITADDLSFAFPAGLGRAGFIDPDAWIRRTHAQNGVHEPGLVSAILWLRGRLQGEDVAFFDIGALFGYVSLLAAAAFDRVEVHCVEANPQSAAVIAEAIERTAQHGTSLHLHNCLIGTERRRKAFVMDGFAMHPPRLGPLLFRVAPELLRAAARRLMGRPANLRRRLARLRERPLTDLLAEAGPGRRIVLKLDTEGYHASFLPPATADLIDLGAVVLLECDAPPTMARFGVTNYELCQPFLAAGYTLMWLNHRRLNEAARLVTGAAEAAVLESNSLAILVPPDLV